MHKKLTFIVLSSGGSRIRQMNTSHWTLVTLALVFLAGMVGVGFLTKDYLALKHSLHHQGALKSDLEDRDAEIAFQKKQIASFAQEINALKTRIVALNDFEKKIRIIANLEVKNEDDNLFGVGGSPPEDIDATDQLKKDQASLLREMHEQVNQLDLASTQQAEGFDALFDSLEDQKNLLACTPSIRPTNGWISSSFGNRRSPFTSRREFHSGLDIANRSGTPIVATANGIIRFVGKKGLLGNLVVIDHGHGMISRYGHLAEGLVKKGEKVKRGDVIAKMGNTGRSTGPHLHYEIRLNGVPINPSNYIID